MIARIVRLEFECLLCFRESFAKVFQFMERCAEAIMIARIVRFKFDCFLRFNQGFVKAF